VLIVAGLNLKNLKPRVWDPESPHYLPKLQAVMVSYADFHQRSRARQQAMREGLRAFLNVPQHIRIYLDNGAFYFISHEGSFSRSAYDEFVASARPDWYPVARDFIPIPQMTRAEQEQCFQRTMEYNLAYQNDGFIPVIHISPFLEQYTAAIQAHDILAAKPAIALGGIVPNLLRGSKALPYQEVLASLWHVRQTFASKFIHVFGIGGTATLHIAALLRMDSVDSSGWRNRAARGIVQLPGRGERLVADLGKWRGRQPDDEEWRLLEACVCPACQRSGLSGLRESGLEGFCNRSTHNLWVLLEELEAVEARLEAGDYSTWYESHLNNSTYLPLVRKTLALINTETGKASNHPSAALET